MQKGLLQQPQQQPSQQIAQQQQAPEQQLSDEQLQQQYADAYEYVEQLSAHPKAVDLISEMIAGGETIQHGLGEAAAFVLVRVEAQKDIGDEVRTELIGDVLEVVFEIAGEMGVIEESDVTDDLVKQVVQHGTERYAEMHEDAGMPLDADQKRNELEEMAQYGAIDEAKRDMPEDAEGIDQMLSMVRGGKN